MTPDVAAAAQLPPRAGVARLTLQLRSLTAELDAAERAATALEAERAAIGADLERRADEQREEVQRARAEAAAVVAAARRAATVIVAKGAPAQQNDPADRTDSERVGTGLDGIPDIVSWLDPPTAAAPGDVAVGAAGSNPGQSPLDPDSIGRAVAIALAGVLDERLSHWGPAAPPAPAAPAKPSMLANAFHPDVLLLFLIMVVSLVVIAAWLA